MENEKSKSGNKMILGIIIGIIIGTVLFGGGYYLLKDKEQDKCNDIKENADMNKENENKDEESNKFVAPKVLSGAYLNSAITLVLSNEEVYVTLDICNTPSTTSLTSKEFCSSIESLTSSYKEYSFDNLNYEAIDLGATYRYKDPLNSNFLGLKLNISNVANVYSVMQGQAIAPNSQGLAFIKNDGSLAIISFNNIVNNNLTPKSISELTDINKVENRISDNGMETVAIDKNNKEYNLYNYFK